jgi:hypothetical protein
MTIDQLLTIVAIIATSITTLAAPILAEFVKSRISQPKPTPELNQPKNRIQRIRGWYIRASSSPWMYLFFAVFNICVLLLELGRVTVPIKRNDVLAISLATGNIFLNFAYIGSILVNRTVGDLVIRSWEQATISRKFVEIIEDFQKQLNAMQEVITLRENLDAMKAAQAPQPAQLAMPSLPAPQVSPKPDEAVGDNAENVEPKNEPEG